MPNARTSIPGSERTPPPGDRVGDAPADARLQVSVYLKRQGTPEPSATGGFTERADLRSRRAESLREPMAQVRRFADAHGLSVVEADPARRLMKLEGSVLAFQSAFGTHLHHYAHQGRTIRGRTGPLSAPAEVTPLIEAVLGLDERPIATPKSMRLASPDANAGFPPNVVTQLYDFPTVQGNGGGECIAIIELGGGFNVGDTTTAFQAMGLTPPDVVAVPVSGGDNQPGGDNGADGEVALDIQVAGAGAPGARLAVYFAPNTDQGFVDAISQAAHDETNKPSVMSISWGSAESGWTQQAVSAMTSALQDAAELGVTVCAASGDGLATDGVSDGKAHVDFPASSPYVLGCGGTRLDAAGAISDETVWNSNGGGTGGGISGLFPVPDYQSGIALPSPVGGGKAGRGVPDVAGDADPDTGYRVVVDGQTQVIGGTSAVAPLWAGLFALVNAQAGKPSGQPHAALYAHPDVFRDTTSGDNRNGGIGYSAGPGWDACTGLGSPRGGAVAALFSGAGATKT